MSLVELMVATAVGVIVLGMASVFLITSTRASTRALTRVTLQEEATLAINRMASDIAETVRAGIFVTPADGATAPVCIAIFRIATPLPDGRQRFDTNATVYEWDGTTLTRRLVAASTLGVKAVETTPPTLPDTALQQLSTAAGSHLQVLETGVTAFRVTHTGTASFTVMLHAERHANTGNQASEAFTVTRSVALRNL